MRGGRSFRHLRRLLAGLLARRAGAIGLRVAARSGAWTTLLGVAFSPRTARTAVAATPTAGMVSRNLRFAVFPAAGRARIPLPFGGTFVRGNVWYFRFVLRFVAFSLSETRKASQCQQSKH